MTASASQYVFDASRDNFQTLVLDNSRRGPVLVNYWTAKAGPCLRLWPTLEKLANDYAGKFLLVNINTDNENTLARDYGVNSVPTVKLFMNAEVVGQVHGAESEKTYRELLDRYVSRDSDNELAGAVAEYQQGKVEQAFAMLDRAILLDPLNTRLFTSYAKLLIRENRYQQAFELLEKTPLKNENAEAGLLMANAFFLHTAQTAPDIAALEAAIEAAPNDAALRLQMASQQIMQSEYTRALDALLHIFKTDRQYRNGIARICMRAIFTLLGADDERVKQYRQYMLDN